MIQLDPHIHTVYSGDATGTPEKILKQAIKLKLDAIAITDHNTMKGSIITRKLAKDYDDITVIPGIEISSSHGHIVALGITEEIKPHQNPEETVDQIHELGGIAIIPHPFVRYRSGLFARYPFFNTIDAIETKNSRFVFGISNGKAEKLSKENNIPQIGSSDSHFIGSIGKCATEVDSDSSNVDDIINAIKKGKTRAYGVRTPLHLIAKEVFNKKILRKHKKYIE